MTTYARNITIYSDANVFISAFETGTERGQQASKVFDAVVGREFSAATSAITLAELLPRPLATGQSDLVAFYLNLLSGQGTMDVVPVTRSILIASAEARARYSAVKLPDAIHLVTAMDRGCAAILSDDRRLPSRGGMPVICLGPDTLGDLRRLAA